MLHNTLVKTTKAKKLMEQFIYSIEMFRNGAWVKENRIYNKLKLFSDFDLCDVCGKRRGASLNILATWPPRKSPIELWETDDWPMPEIEERFDWSLSMRDIEKKYLPKRNRFIIDKYTYLPPIPKEKKKKIDIVPSKKKPKLVESYFKKHAGDVHLSINNNTPKKPAVKFPDWVQRYLQESEPDFHEK